ncbi:MAG TPA: AMP-binding protein [Gemmatales bacterium]|nr:AMP-binding protein [Gemmatales bacterium]
MPPIAAVSWPRLQAGLDEVLASNAFYRTKLGIKLHVDSWESYRQLPFTTKDELQTDQADQPPYGTNLTCPLTHYRRCHQTSGSTGQPLRWLDTAASWNWLLDLWDTIFGMAGVTSADRCFFPFSFGPFLGFWAAFEGAARLGCFTLPGGGMTTQARLQAIADHGITVVCCTPTYAMRLAEAGGTRLASSPVRALILAGEPGASVDSVRQMLEAAWGARVFDHWGMSELGSLGMECRENPGGFHLLEDHCISEVLDPIGGDPVTPGSEGELVVTNLGRWGSPLIRYRTGDRVRVDPEPCPCGRPWQRLAGGVLGRTDDLIFIRGNNVYPSMIEAVVRRFPAVREFQIEVDATPGRTELLLHLELAGPVERQGLEEAVAREIQTAFHFRPQVRLVPPGSLPRSEMKSRRLLRKLS